MISGLRGQSRDQPSRNTGWAPGAMRRHKKEKILLGQGKYKCVAIIHKRVQRYLQRRKR